MSAPAQKQRPSAASTMQRVLDSALSDRKASLSSAIIVSSKAFSRAGRTKTTRAIPCPSFSIVRVCMTRSDLQSPASSGPFGSIKPDVFAIERLLIDPDARRRDPIGKFPGLSDPDHQRLNECAVVRGRQPIIYTSVPLCLAHDLSFG